SPTPVVIATAATARPVSRFLCMLFPSLGPLGRADVPESLSAAGGCRHWLLVLRPLGRPRRTCKGVGVSWGVSRQYNGRLGSHTEVVRLAFRARGGERDREPAGAGHIGAGSGGRRRCRRDPDSSAGASSRERGRRWRGRRTLAARAGHLTVLE